MAAADHGGDTGPERAQHHHQHLAARIAQRPHAPSEHAVGERERRHHQRRRADRDAELARDLRQQRVAHAQVGGADESGQRQQHDGARRRVAGGACRSHSIPRLRLAGGDVAPWQAADFERAAPAVLDALDQAILLEARVAELSSALPPRNQPSAGRGAG